MGMLMRIASVLHMRPKLMVTRGMWLANAGSARAVCHPNLRPMLISTFTSNTTSQRMPKSLSPPSRRTLHFWSDIGAWLVLQILGALVKILIFGELLVFDAT